MVSGQKTKAFWELLENEKWFNIAIIPLKIFSVKTLNVRTLYTDTLLVNTPLLNGKACAYIFYIRKVSWVLNGT